MINRDYQALPAISSHRLKELLDSCSLAEWHRQFMAAPHPSIELPSAAIRLGTLVHCLALTPHWLDQEFLVADYERRSQAGKARYAALVATGLTAIKPAELERARAMVTALQAYPDARQLLRGGQKEKIVLQPRASGLWPLKGRLDLYHERQHLIVELKTIHSLRAIATAMDRYRYPLSAALYQHLVKGQQVIFIFVQTQEPHDIAVFELPRWQLQEGREQWQLALARFDECWTTNHWPDAPLDLIPNLNPPRSSHRLEIPVGELAL